MVVRIEVYWHEQDSGQGSDIHYCNEGRASILKMMILIWSNALTIDLDDEHSNEAKGRLLLAYKIWHHMTSKLRKEADGWLM